MIKKKTNATSRNLRLASELGLVVSRRRPEKTCERMRSTSAVSKCGEVNADRFFFSSRRRHTRWTGDWSSDVCSSDLRINFGADTDPRKRSRKTDELSC